MTENVSSAQEIGAVPHLELVAPRSPKKVSPLLEMLKNALIGASGFVLLAVFWQFLSMFRELPSVFAIARELGL